VKAQGMDSPDVETLCTLPDNAQSWRDVGFIVGALETHEVRDVSKRVRPIQVGPVGPHGLVIA
jgi:hypothetical protein